MAEREKDKLSNPADVFYSKVAKDSVAAADERGRRTKVYYQDDLRQIAGVDSAKELMPLIQDLTNAGLFRTLKVGSRLAWSVRPRDAGKAIKGLDREERLIYEIIEEAHEQGVWVKSIRAKSGLAQTIVTKATEKLEKKNLIKAIKTVRNPAQKTYILYHLVPGEDVTGNSFFDAGELDEGFRDELQNLIVFHVRQLSWAQGRVQSRRHDEDDGGVGKKRKRDTDIEDLGHRFKHRSAQFDPETDFVQVTYKANTHQYPTAEDIHRIVLSTGVVKEAKSSSLTVEEIQGCLDVMCWDDKLEKVPSAGNISWGYRTVRGVEFRPPGLGDPDNEHVGTGLTQVPCGRCPVFDICSEDSPVNPRECTYFTDWLKP